ncbi:MAG: GGDEF domain-containing protein [Acidobacteria bacterium]|nr:GGDEF domain-containing protein [Acidobacteriota bacterium]
MSVQTFLDFVHPDSRGIMIESGFILPPTEHSSKRYEIRIITKRGEARWLDVTMGTMELEGQLAHVMTAVDITERKQMEEQIHQLLLSDSLTGLGNYRQLVNAISEETERSFRTGRSFTVVLLDLNNLKKINDRYGHLVGNQALCRVADILRLGCRTIDTVARFGGDEFALLLPETGIEGARDVAERIAQQVMNDCKHPSISVSFGVAMYPEDGRTIDEILRTADAALYVMKEGSNR